MLEQTNSLALCDFWDTAKHQVLADHDKFDETVCILFSQFLHDDTD